MKKEKKLRARDLRKFGWSIGEIAKQLGVAKSSVSLWVRDIPLTDQQQLALDLKNPVINPQNSKGNSEFWRLRRKESQDQGKERVQWDPILQQLAMLYWGEGDKGRNSVGVSNGDWRLIKFYKNSVESIFDVVPNDWALTIHLHATHELTVKEIQNFWLKNLDLSPSSLRKAVVDRRPRSANNPPKYKLPYGLGRLTLGRTDIVQTIFGAIQGLGEFNEPQWLQ